MLADSEFALTMMLKASLALYLEHETIFLSFHIINISRIIGLWFFLHRCSEMLYSIKEKGSRIAQQSVNKFQYILIGSVMGFGLALEVKFERLNVLWMLMFCWIVAPLIHLAGDHFVLKIFKRKKIENKIQKISFFFKQSVNTVIFKIKH